MVSLLKNAGLIVCLSSGLMVGAQALAPDFMEKLESEERPAEDRERDGARRPYQVMQLLGVQEGMTAVDVGAGGGWFTRVLSAAVGSSGKVYAQFGARALQNNDGQTQKDLAAALGNVEPVFTGVNEMEAATADVVVTALNMHHMNAETGTAYLREILDVLKPGGRAAIIDHEGSEGGDNASLHRMTAADAKAWIEAAGFEIVTESDLLHTSADDHSLPVFAPELGRDTDQFLFVVSKPE